MLVPELDDLKFEKNFNACQKKKYKKNANLKKKNYLFSKKGFPKRTMSGFGKNQASTRDDAWRQNLLKLIFQKREPIAQNSEPKIVNRCSLSLSEDFQDLLKETKEKKKAKVEDMQRHEQNFEHYDITMAGVGPVDDTQFANESFEALELMCEKTGSDPDSTLFKYLHSGNREEVLADAKNRAGSTNSTQELDALDAESAALQRMLKDLNMLEEDDQLESESPLKGVECTQLEDVEAPSRLWDSTVIGVETSPVKMVGLMRPSTILEGCEDDSMSQSDISSQFSYQTAAVKNDRSATASSCYETANDQSAATSHNTHYEEYDDKSNDGQCADVDNLFYAALAKMKPVLMNDEREELLQDLHETVNLIDLEATFSAAKKSPNAISMEKTITTTESKDLNDESVIEILSDDDENEEPLLNTTPYVKEEKLSISKHTNEMSGLSLLKEEDGKSNTKYAQQNGNKENDEESLHFNDTMEEVEYMMRKGLEYMAAKVAQTTAETPTQIDTIKMTTEPTLTLTKQNTFLLSPKQITDKAPNVSKMKPLVSSNVNSPRNFKTVTPNKVFTGSFSSTAKTNSPKVASQTKAKKPCKKGLLIDFDRQPQIPFFKQPTGIPTLRQKELKQPYAHIISPIRAYVQKTATAPLMTSLKAKNSNVDVLNATGFRQAEHDSRHHQPEFGVKNVSSNGDKIPGVPMNVNLLPSKAYISSEFKHIVDERTPVTIPGGQKMQKLLESAVATTVLRHDGKIKVPGLDGHATSRLPRPREQRSLADLSVMSGDVSLYTIKDAHKF